MVHTPSSIKARKKKFPKPSKEELERRRAKQKEVEARTGVKRGGAEIGTRAFERQEARRKEEVITPTQEPTREPTPTRPDEPVRLGFEKEKQGFISFILKPQVFRDLQAEGKLHAGSLPIGITTQAAAAFEAIQFPLTKAATFIPKSSVGLTKLTRLPGVGGELVKGKAVAIRSLPLEFGRVGNNLKNFGLKKSILQRLAAAARDPRLLLGVLMSGFFTSLFWAPNEKGDALLSLQIAQAAALKNGDVEGVFEIDALIQETLDISASVPVIGFLKSEFAKFKSAAKASEIAVREAEKIREEQTRITEQGETDFARERRESDEAAIERKKVEEERQEKRFKDIKEKGEERVLEEEERQAERFADIDIKRRETKLAEQKAETERFEEIDRVRKEEKLRVALLWQEVWRLRNLKRYDEANDLELTIFQ